MPRINLVIVICLIIGTAVTSCFVTWYAIDRDGFIVSMCEASLPNPTLPSVEVADDLQCAVFEERKTYFGIVQNNRSAEHSVMHFKSDALRSKNGSEDEASALLDCDADHCAAKLGKVLAQNSVEGCGPSPVSFQFAGAAVEGWVTRTEHPRGHFPIETRVFVVKEIKEAFQPAASHLDEVATELARICPKD